MAFLISHLPILTPHFFTTLKIKQGSIITGDVVRLWQKSKVLILVSSSYTQRPGEKSHVGHMISLKYGNSAYIFRQSFLEDIHSVAHNCSHEK